MNPTRPFCTVPFAEAFSGNVSDFRNCCMTSPQIASAPGQTFSNWWSDPRRIEFAKGMYTDQWPTECYRCRQQEEYLGHSFRTAVNDQVSLNENFGVWPSRWNLKFGNICNLACWTCGEHSSSVIAQHKKIINILPNDFVDPEEKFAALWPQLEADVLKSYDYHDTVTLTLLGGEPLYNKTVNRFLMRLIELGLSARTRLEFHTNGTTKNAEIFKKDTWQYVCVFLSIDAVGKKIEWLRYGARWPTVESTVNFFKSVCDYMEVHCTLSILNINDLPALDRFCRSQSLPLSIITVADPDYMSLAKWPGDPQLIVDQQTRDGQFDYYYNLIGSEPDATAPGKLRDYINQFSAVRRSLRDYDSHLADAVGLD